MKIRALAKWNPRSAFAASIPKGKGLLLLEVEPEFRDRLSEELGRLKSVQTKKLEEAEEKWSAAPGQYRGKRPAYEDFLVLVDVSISIHYKKRSVNQNALYWKLLEIEANYLNGTPKYRDGYWSKKDLGGAITPQQIHDDDLETYAQKWDYFVQKDVLFGFGRGMESEVGKVMRKEPVGSGDTFKVSVWRTTSYLDTKEFSAWTNRVIERLTDGGLLRTDEAEFLILKREFKEIVEGE